MWRREERDWDCCPACGRAFRRIHDYPSVRILAFERLPIPEAVDTLSRATCWRKEGINMTPRIVEACRQERVQTYLARLESLVGCELDPGELNPPWQPDGYFQFAHPLDPEEAASARRRPRLFLAVSEPYNHDADAIPPAEGERFAHIVVDCDGINFGSGGGPTLQRLGVIARIRYQGLLKAALRDAVTTDH